MSSSYTYQQFPSNEKGSFDAPPPYYAPASANAPLLPPPATATSATVIVTKKQGTSCCGVVCSVTAIIVSTIFCCCCCVGLVAAIVFGVWASQCADLQYQLTLQHSATLTGAGEKEIEIRNYGNLQLKSVLVGTNDIKTLSEISANSYDEALSPALSFEQSSTSFSLKYASPLWSCTKQDVTAELFDRASLSPVSLSLESFSGDLSTESFVALSFSEVELFSRSGDITFGFFNASEAKIETLSGGIKSTAGASALELDLETYSGDIDISTLSIRKLELEANSGDIKINNIVILGGGECKIEAEARAGDIDIENIALITNSACKIYLEALSGEVKVKLANFGGTYSVISYGGTAKVNGNECSKEACEGAVAGGSSYLEVRAYSGDADVTFVL